MPELQCCYTKETESNGRRVLKIKWDSNKNRRSAGRKRNQRREMLWMSTILQQQHLSIGCPLMVLLTFWMLHIQIEVLFIVDPVGEILKGLMTTEDGAASTYYLRTNHQANSMYIILLISWWSCMGEKNCSVCIKWKKFLVLVSDRLFIILSFLQHALFDGKLLDTDWNPATDIFLQQVKKRKKDRVGIKWFA